MRKWTKEMEHFVKTNYKKMPDKTIAQKLNIKYGTNFSASAIKSRREKLGLKVGHKRSLKYTDEVVDFILRNYEGKDNIELANLLNQKFNLNTNGDKISMFKGSYKRRYGIDLRTGINKGCFKKGNVPINKGTKGILNVGGNKTSFKKGNIPANSDHVGTEKWKSSHKNRTDEGFLYVKIQDKRGRYNWKQKHRLIWEESYGPIPKGYKVIFLDGDRHHIELSNLMLVSNSQMLIMNKNNLIYKEKELTKTGHLIAKVIEKSRKIKK